MIKKTKTSVLTATKIHEPLAFQCMKQPLVENRVEIDSGSGFDPVKSNSLD